MTLWQATVKKVIGTGIFVSISGNVDGVIWPNHYADITLKHPEKRFKEGATIKCKVGIPTSNYARVADLIAS
jgi:rRNA biogenesis protein RRP5